MTCTDTEYTSNQCACSAPSMRRWGETLVKLPFAIDTVRSMEYIGEDDRVRPAASDAGGEISVAGSTAG